MIAGRLIGLVVPKTKVVHHKKHPYDVFIARPSKWGNPFSLADGKTRAEVIQLYREWILTQPNLMKDLAELEGKVLGCWCKPLPCHGDVLVDLLEERKINKLLDF